MAYIGGVYRVGLMESTLYCLHELVIVLSIVCMDWLLFYKVVIVIVKSV